MNKIAAVCKVLSFRKNKMKRGKTLTSNPVGQSAAAVVEQEIADALPDPERLLLEKEKLSGLHEMAYLDFCYAIKRFTFNGGSLNDKVFQRICPELNLEWEQVINESEVTPQWLNWRNKHLFENGVWDLDKMLSLGFLLCAHPSRQDQREEFW